MVAMRRTNRCANCRRKKIKCDEQWPSCSACRRANIPCPGRPTRTYRFIAGRDVSSSGVDGQIDSVEREDEERVCPASRQQQRSPPSLSESSSLVVLREQPAGEGPGSFIKLRAHGATLRKPRPFCIPQSPPPTHTDTASSRLVWAIEAGLKGDAPDICVKSSWIHLVPQRLEQTPVLTDAVVLLLSTLSNRRRGLPFASELHRGAYGRCMASLRSALMQPEEVFRIETLTAVLLVTKIEFDHETSRSANQSFHGQGLRALMAERGPPDISDDLDVRICYDSIGTLLSQFLLNEEEVFYSRPEWLRAMRAGLGGCRDKDGRRQKGYRLDLIMIHWPNLVRKLRQARHSNDLEITAELITTTKRMLEELATFQAEVLDPLINDGTIWVMPGSAGVCEIGFGFTDWSAFQIFVDHAMTSLAMCRILYAAMELMGFPSQQLELPCREWSERIWKTLQYAESLPRDKQDHVIGPIVLSYEGADGLRRSWIMSKLRQISGPRARFLGPRPEEVLLNMCTEFTGRGSARQPTPAT